MTWLRDPDDEVRRLTERVRELEREIGRLRESRRLLLELLTMKDQQQKLIIGALQRENRRLRTRRPPR
ncbi:MAG: hypothetical protein OWU84_13075 [Firmicutes bacterium]|nr:hypothetical protein [Bacillota bacterium]